MVVERYTHERAVEVAARFAEREMSQVQGQQRRLDILASAGLPRVRGPRPLNNGTVEMVIYTWQEAAAILMHHRLCWHQREKLLREGGSRANPTPMPERRKRWAATLTVLALAPEGSLENDCCDWRG